MNSQEFAKLVDGVEQVKFCATYLPPIVHAWIPKDGKPYHGDAAKDLGLAVKGKGSFYTPLELGNFAVGTFDVVGNSYNLSSFPSSSFDSKYLPTDDQFQNLIQKAEFHKIDSIKSVDKA